MERIILHVDVNNAFLSWSAVWLLKNGYGKDIRNRYAVIAGDETQRRGIVLAKSNLCKKNGNKLIYATDTNRIDHIIAKNYDYYFIEGNYENEEELHQRAENQYYENRVKNTHLSKVSATEWLMNNMGNNSKYMFMHVHKERNKNEVRPREDR